MTRQQLIQQINKKKSYLCVGLDTDITKIPPHLLKYKNPILEFNKQIIDATHDVCVAYKPNLAFYEIYGAKGWETLEKTIQYIPGNIFKIADAKRGDIGNTSARYAEAFFKTMQADAITVAPYMGADSVKPFLDFQNKWVILLALTSNSGAANFQMQTLQNQHTLYTEVLKQSELWGTTDNMMYVVGATQAEALKEIRKTIPHHFLLVPGVGAQGGSLADVAKHGMNSRCGLLVNASRSIIYASSNINYAHEAAKQAQLMQKEMADLLRQYLK